MNARQVFGLILACACLATRPAAGQSRVVRIPSRVLGETRVLHISTPPNYTLARQRYPVVVLLDGQARPFFELTTAVTSYDLTGDVHDFAMPAQIVVAIEQSDRGVDLNSNDAQFTRFLLDELLPYVDREYRTLPFRTLIGHSLGGRFALLSLCRAPDAFAATIAVSPSASDSLLTAVESCVRSYHGSRTRTLVVSAGSQEPRASAAVQRLATLFRDSMTAGATRDAWRFSLVDGTGLGHTETPFYTIPDGLRFAFATEQWEIARSAADSLLQHVGEPLDILNGAYRGVRKRLGFELPFSSKWMAAVVRAYLAQRNIPSAQSAARAMIASYPEEILGYALLADANLAASDRASARRALGDALSMIDKLAWFDETQRDRQRAHFRESLAAIPPG